VEKQALEFSNTGKHLSVGYKIPTGWYIPHDILWVLPRYRAMQNTRDVRIAVNKWLWPLQRVVIPITKVGTQKKLSIASQRRVKYCLAVWAGYYQFPIINDRANKTI
jgi:hypothetical protein